MLGLLQAFVEQVGHMGVKGLAEAVHPAAGMAVDLFGGVWKRWQLNRHPELPQTLSHQSFSHHTSPNGDPP